MGVCLIEVVVVVVDDDLTEDVCVHVISPGCLPNPSFVLLLLFSPPRGGFV